MLMASEQKCINALKMAVDKCYSEADYSLFSYSECAVCLEKKDDIWEVYYGERCAHHDSESFSNILEACICFIKKLGSNTNTKGMIQDFTEYLTISDIPNKQAV